MSKVSVLHLSHLRENKGLAMFPVGERYNRELTQLRKGDVICFQSDEEYPVVSVAVLGLHTAIAEFMSRYIYGKPLSRVKAQWGINAVAEGYPRDCISDERCLIIHYEIPPMRCTDELCKLRKP